jgi:hypothetical protein
MTQVEKKKNFSFEWSIDYCYHKYIQVYTSLDCIQAMTSPRPIW